LVSQPSLGRIVKLTPGTHGTAAPHVLLSGLTLPQGMAFARVAGHWVLYVGESVQIDRYPWDAGRIGGARAAIAPPPPRTRRGPAASGPATMSTGRRTWSSPRAVPCISAWAARPTPARATGRSRRRGR